MMRCLLILLLCLLLHAERAAADDGSVVTLWPAVDYRASASADYSSLHLLGPFLKYETKGFETEYAFRPFFYRAVDDEGESSTDILYPAIGHKNDKGVVRFHLFHLLHSDFGPREAGSRNQSYLFPFLFYGEDPEQGRYAAFFPLHGTLYNWFGRDRISFTLFPLYSRTEKAGTRVDNVLWPFFARISGEDEAGIKVWPVYGHSAKQGVYRKTFFLWPLFFSQSLALDTANPSEYRAFWPFYVNRESPQLSETTYLWPFFKKTVNRAKEYESMSMPWPLVRITTGERYHGMQLLPFYADETMDVKRQRWYLWPVYKIEEMHSELIERRRDRLLFFLYSDTRELKRETDASMRRIALWPLFGYKRSSGVSHLHVLAPVEPVFPDNDAIERLWSPLWRLYQQKWDDHGNAVVSLIWNLFWSERQGDRLAWELFPLVEYRRQSSESRDLKLLKGLIRYRAEDGARSLNLLFLPWGLSWGAVDPTPH